LSGTPVDGPARDRTPTQLGKLGQSGRRAKRSDQSKARAAGKPRGSTAPRLYTVGLFARQ